MFLSSFGYDKKRTTFCERVKKKERAHLFFVRRSFEPSLEPPSSSELLENFALFFFFSADRSPRGIILFRSLCARACEMYRPFSFYPDAVPQRAMLLYLSSRFLSSQREKKKRERERTASSSSSSSSSSYLSRARAKPSEALDYDADAAFVFPEPPCLPRVFFRDLYFFTETLKSTVFLPFLSLRSEFRDYKSTPCASVTYTHTHHTK